MTFGQLFIKHSRQTYKTGQPMTNTLGVLLKDSAYKLIQFSEDKIQMLEAKIITKDIRGKSTPYINCLVRNMEMQLTSIALQEQGARFFR